MRENKSTKVRHGLFIIPPKQSCYCSFATQQKQFIQVDFEKQLWGKYPFCETMSKGAEVGAQ